METFLSDLLNPEVLGDIVSGKVSEKVVVAPFAKIDTTLEGVPGSEITIPVFSYIGDAEEIAEGAKVGTAKLGTTTTKHKIKKAMKSVALTDEALECGYGNVENEVGTQLGKSLSAKIDNDALEAITTPYVEETTPNGVKLIADLSTSAISYNGIIDAVDYFNEEIDTEKVMFINPKQKTTLRKDPNFISKDRYNGEVVMNGEIGKIAGCRIVPTKKVKNVDGFYNCPILKLDEDAETEDETPAVTIFLKRRAKVEKQRHSDTQTTDIIASTYYVAALTNQQKVVLAKYKA